MAPDTIIRPSTVAPTTLSELAAELGLDHRGPDCAVTGISVHTGLVAPGDLFVAMSGSTRHGVEFWSAAKSAGAVALLTDLSGFEMLGSANTPVLLASSPRDLLGLLAARIYHTHQGTVPALFGVTGTNGKTSTAFLLDAVMRALGWSTALSTTAERRVANRTYASTLTTPEAPDTHALLALAMEQGVTGVALEISAQALDKKRLDGVVVDVAGFTNLSHDHFEDFGGMERYLLAKAALFTPQHARTGVICIDSSWGHRMTEISLIPAVTLAEAGGPEADWTYRVVSEEDDSTVFDVRAPDGTTARLWAPIIGAHMVSNAALAVAMIVTHGSRLSDIEAAVGEHTAGIPVYLPGRIERVTGFQGPQVFVDAGHSEDAYRVTLDTIRSRTAGKLIMVCGVSGNRDPSKRPIMGKLAATLADVVIVTDTSPRGEDPAQVRAGLLQGARSVEGAEIYDMGDPGEAIGFAVSLAKEGDSVVWMGQGSQPYRDLGPEKIPFSALEEVREALKRAGWPADRPPLV